VRSYVPVVGAVLLYASCAPPAAECGERRTLDLAPETPGTYDVGVRTWLLTYVPIAGGPERTVRAYAWYPTRDTDRDGMTYLDLWPDPESLVDATPAEPVDGCAYPVFAHSHGFQGFAGGSAHLMKHFASHGWVAVGVDHTGNTIADHVDPLATSHYVSKPKDVSALLDALAALPDGDPLSKADVSKVVLGGHSFGTYTTWALAGATTDAAALTESCKPGGAFPQGSCSEAELQAFSAGFRDPRVVGVIPMAGGFRRSIFGAGGQSTVAVPMLQMTGSEDDVGFDEDWDSFAGLDLAWIDLAGGCHETFNIGTCSTLEREAGWTIVDAYALAFARRHVLGDDSADVTGLVDGTRPISAKVTYRRR